MYHSYTCNQFFKFIIPFRGVATLFEMGGGCWRLTKPFQTLHILPIIYSKTYTMADKWGRPPLPLLVLRYSLWTFRFAVLCNEVLCILLLWIRYNGIYDQFQSVACRSTFEWGGGWCSKEIYRLVWWKAVNYNIQFLQLSSDVILWYHCSAFVTKLNITELNITEYKMRIGRVNSILPRITDLPWSSCQLLPTSQTITDRFCKKWRCDNLISPTLARPSLQCTTEYNHTS